MKTTVTYTVTIHQNDDDWVELADREDVLVYWMQQVERCHSLLKREYDGDCERAQQSIDAQPIDTISLEFSMTRTG